MGLARNVMCLVGLQGGCKIQGCIALLMSPAAGPEAKMRAAAGSSMHKVQSGQLVHGDGQALSPAGQRGLANSVRAIRQSWHKPYS